LGINTNGQIVLSLGSEDNAWDIANRATSTATLAPSSTYYLKLTFDGFEYDLKVSTDNERYTDYIVVNNNTPTKIHNGRLYLGIDGIKPFIEDCRKYNKGIFILVKTSNKSSGELQDLKLEDGKTVYEKVAELVNSWGEELVGEYGYSSVSSVVGATYPVQLETLRKIMPTSYFLIPGYGAQGGKAEDIALGFDENGLGGIVNASRSLMCAYKSDRWKDEFKDEEYAKATRAEAIRMRDELNSAIQK
jgi:orotidine-5'-phosphate decarboxylase